jgi:hypothetical protein
MKIIADSYHLIPKNLKYYFAMTIPFHEMDKAIWNCFNNILIDKINVEHSFNQDIAEIFGRIYPINMYPEKKDIDMDLINNMIIKNK